MLIFMVVKIIHHFSNPTSTKALLVKDSIRDISQKYLQVSNIRRALVCNNIVDHSDVVGAPPVGAAPTTSSFST